ncbi:MAG: hypothetical protein FWE53_03105 [Firmicutes bacterium]|nr:hypothetical protein [Bacillota bacterium]
MNADKMRFAAGLTSVIGNALFALIYGGLAVTFFVMVRLFRSDPLSVVMFEIYAWVFLIIGVVSVAAVMLGAMMLAKKRVKGAAIASIVFNALILSLFQIAVIILCILYLADSKEPQEGQAQLSGAQTCAFTSEITHEIAMAKKLYEDRIITKEEFNRIVIGIATKI